VGGGLDLVHDLPDGVFSTDHARFGFGGALRGLARYRFAQGVAARATLSTGFERGSDRVQWLENQGTVAYYSDSHWTLLTATRLTVGPELSVQARSGLRPYGGADVGLAWVQTWHSFHGDTAILVDPSQNDVGNRNNIDPYVSQLVPAAGLHLGVAIEDVAPFAIEVEAGYYVSFLDQATLRKAPDEAEAIRDAFGLNVLHVGVAASIPIGAKADP